MGKIVRVKKGNQEFDVEESKLPLAIKDGFQPIGKPEKLYTVVKGDKEFDVKESLLSQAEADGFKKKSGTTTVSATPEKTTQEPTSSSQPFTPTKSPLGVQSPFVGGSVVPTDIFNQPQVQEIGSETPLSINPRSIPVTPYATPEAYVNSLQQRINTGKLTNQDKAVLDRNKRGKFFNGQDDAELSKLSSKYGAEIQSGDFESKLAAIDKIKNKIQNNIANEKVDYKSIIGVSGIERPTSADSKYDFELDALENMRDKLIREKAVREPYEKYQSATARTDEGGSWLNQIGNFASNYFTPTGATGGFAGTRDASYQVKDQPAELSIGLNVLKYEDPIAYERTVKSLSTGAPISESQLALIKAKGIEGMEDLAEVDLANGKIDKEKFNQTQQEIKQKRYENLVENKEVLRSVMADGIANMADEANNYAGEGATSMVMAKKLFGNRWNYSDQEIADYGKAVAKSFGLDPNDKRVQDAIKYLQDNEGVMVFNNSIAKNGWTRDFAKGLAQPIQGIASTVSGMGKTNEEKYAESMSAGSTGVAQKKLTRIENSWEGTVSDIMEGTGQLATQMALAYATGGTLTAMSEGLLGRAGMAAIGGDIALADMSAGEILGSALLKNKNTISTLVTTYASSYDDKLKQAMNYTSDNAKARGAAAILSSVDALAEGILSPIELAEGIVKKFANPKASKGIIDILSDSKIIDKSSALKDYLKGIGKGALETAKVGVTEIGEEELGTLADFAVNAYLSPNTKQYQDRDLVEEMANTAYQTGLSMVVPALVSGIGAARVNTFAKGSLLVAGQNRQRLIDAMDKMKKNGELTEDEYNEKVHIVNNAAKANDALPLKNDGTKLTSKEKLNYIYSRVAEGSLERQAEKTTDKAERLQKETQIKKQQEYREKVLSLKPMYFVNSEEVDKKEFDKILSSPNVNDFDLSVENDNVTQEKLRKVGGKDVNDADKTERDSSATSQDKKVKAFQDLQKKRDNDLQSVDARMDALDKNAPEYQASLDDLNNEKKSINEFYDKEESKQGFNELSVVDPKVKSLLEGVEEEDVEAGQEGRKDVIETPVVEVDTAAVADKRARELSGKKPSVPTKEESLANVRKQRAQEEIEEAKRAEVANRKVEQMLLDKIPMPESAPELLAKMDRVKGSRLGVFRELAKENPKGFLKFVAEQAAGYAAGTTEVTSAGNAKKAAIKAFTQDVVNVALEMFPPKKVEENVTEKQSEKPGAEVTQKVDTTVQSTESKPKEQASKKEVQPSVKPVEPGAAKAATPVQKPVGKEAAVIEKKKEEVKVPESKEVETTPSSNPALRDVESTAKALRNKDISNVIVPESKIKQKVYHGSDNIITGEFKNLNPNIVGYWFSSDIDNAKTYGKNVSSYYLDIKNPLVIDAKGLKFTDDIPVEVLSDYSSLDPSEKPKLITLPIGADEIVSMVKNGKKKNQLIEIPNREQYDGVVFKNFIDPSLTYRREVSQDTVVAFENSQIKKANNEFISEAYHKAKADGSNPELVKAVEEVLGEKLSEPLVEVEEVKGQSQPIEGDRIDLPPNVKGGMSREFVFNDGVWKQQVGGVVSAVGAKTQEQAQKAWDNKGKTMPQIEVTGVDAKLFDEIEKALSLIGSNNKQMALQDLHTGKNAKYTKEQVDKAIEIMANFDRITKDMEREGLLKKECKT